MADHVFTPDQIVEGIGRAIRDREFEMVPPLLRLLAVQDPHLAERVLTGLQDALAGKVTVTLNVGRTFASPRAERSFADGPH